MTTTTPKQRKSLVQKETVQVQCFIHHYVNPWDVEHIRHKVCVSASDCPLTKFNDEHYCLFHLPVEEKNDDAKFDQHFQLRLDAVEKRLVEIENLPEDERETAKSEVRYDFRYVWFPSMVDLDNYKFSVYADFSGATFSTHAKFTKTTFSAYADFTKTTFSTGAYFNKTTFSTAAYFSFATFSTGASFYEAKFLEASEVYFSGTKFEGGVDFRSAVLDGYLIFEGSRYNELFTGKASSLNLDNARISDSKKISFHNVRLEPSWFINIDASEFIFINCVWQYHNGKKLNTKTELHKLSSTVFIPEGRVSFRGNNALLTKICRQLAKNYEELKGFEEASVFRQIANESKRLPELEGYGETIFSWCLSELLGFKFWTLHWWYWLSSCYGERWQRALIVLLFILGGFALIFTQTDFQSCPNNRPLAVSISECVNTPEYCKCKIGGLTLNEAVNHSLATALFQNVEDRKPLTLWGELSTYLEKIFAPLQAALLALAVRRKFMQ